MKNIEKSIKTLEFDVILEMLAELAPTEGSAQLARALRPSSDPDVVVLRQRHTSDAKRLAGIKGMPSFGRVKDISDSAERAYKGAALSMRELLDIAAVLKTSRLLVEYIKTDHNFETSLDEIFERLVPNHTLENKITRAIISEDMIADDASPELADIRRKMRNTSNKIRDLLQKYITGGTNAKYLQENIVTTRNGRYVIPVKAEYKNEVKGLVHDTSASGATLFIEPMSVLEANNELRTLESNEAHEIERILLELSAMCGDFAEGLRFNYKNITELAFYFTCSELSYKMKAVQPKLSGDRTYSLYKARHPLLDSEKVVPIDIFLGGEYRMLVVTGPNTGGKTVTLKTLGLFAFMAQSGLHIPAEEPSSICLFDQVLADIGDEQSIEQSLSTFSSHMVGIVSIMDKLTDKSLVVFDELGAGTDPVEGAALAISILEQVLEKGAMCAATTHYAELKAFALETEGVRNASCEFDVETLRPTYKLIIGTPGKSNAFAISEKLGLSDKIVNRARELVNSDNKNFEYVIEKLEATRMEMERERDEAARLKSEFEQFKTEAETELNRQLNNAKRDAEKAKQQAQQILSGAKATSEFILNQLDEIKKQQDEENFGAKLAAAKKAIRAQLKFGDDIYNPVEDIDEDYVLPRPVKKGDEVIIRNLGKRGVVIDEPDKNGNVTIRAGAVKTRTKIENLRLIENSDKHSKPEQKDKNSVGGSYRTKISRDFKTELDVRGMTGDDAWFMVDKYLDEANVAGISSVTIIHGKGTGALRLALWGYFKKDPRVKNFRSGAFGEGDYGVTVIELK